MKITITRQRIAKPCTPRLGALLTVYLFATAHAPGATRYVDLNSANPTPPYTDWSTAATNIQDAVDAAVAGDEILVTNGIYAPVVVGATKPLSLRGVNGPEFTVIRGRPSFRCVTLAKGARLSGFTLTNGSTPPGLIFDGQGNPINPIKYSGGGVFCFGANTVVSNCVLVGNSAEYAGGGASGGTLINCTLANNSAGWGGGASGGVYASISGGTLINCTLTGNSAVFDGGGTYGGVGVEFCTLIYCTLTNNSARASGGGARDCTLNNCALTGNSSGFAGSGARDCILNNCTVTDNSGEGALYCTLNNCTLTGNFTGAYGGTLNNCIVYNNFLADYEGNSILNFCCTESMPANGVGNITSAPLFINEFGGNFRLQSNSPCINTGLNTFAPAGPGLDGNPRIVGGTVDMGAYEFQSLSLINFGVVANQFGFNITGQFNWVIVLETSRDLASWTPLTTNTLGASPFLFRDPTPPNLPQRFYRARQW